MPRGKKELTERQATIKRMVEDNVDVAEIANVLDTSAQAVHTQISRLRSQGVLPKSKRAGRPQEPKVAASNGYSETHAQQAVEDRIVAERQGIITRLGEIEQELTQLDLDYVERKAALDMEHEVLDERNGRLALAERVMAGTFGEGDSGGGE